MTNGKVPPFEDVVFFPFKEMVIFQCHVSGLKLLPFSDLRFGHLMFCPIYFGLTFA